MHELPITVATFENMESARRMEHTLEGIGIEADVQNDDPMQHDILRMKKPHATYHVQVNKEDVVRVESLMKQWHDELKGLITCPSCGKSRVVFPQITRRFQNVMWPELLLCKLGLMKPSFYCENCHYQWSAKLLKTKTSGVSQSSSEKAKP